MKRILNRILSVFLIFIMVFAAIPAVSASASTQPAGIDKLSITRSTPTDTNDKTYTLNLTWTRTTFPNDADITFKGYEITYRNVTNGTEGAVTVSPNQADDNAFGTTTQSRTLASLPLMEGCIYSFTVTPFHTHTTMNTLNQPVSIIHKGQASPESLFLTDINVSAVGAGTKISVTWDNPTYNGQALFSGYRIYYNQIVNGVPTGTINDITVATADLTFINGKCNYIIESPVLKVAQFYDVRIEPMYLGGTDPLRIARRSIINLPGNIQKTVNIAYTPVEERLYRDRTYMQPTLKVVPEDQTHIRLYWDLFPNTNGEVLLDRVEISKSTTPNEGLDPDIGLWTQISILYGDSARTLSDLLTEKPAGITYYKVTAFYGTEKMVTNVVMYDPTNNDFEPYVPTILPSSTIIDPKYTMQIDWKAFTRNPYTLDEANSIPPEFGNVFVDDKLSYRVWITDKLDNFSDTAIDPLYVQEIAAKDLALNTSTDNDGVLTFFYRAPFNQYVSKGASGFSAPLPLADNKVYYIRILAIRDNGQQSKFAYYSMFIPASGDINQNPNMISAPPVRIQLVDGVENITDTSIGIEWDRKWYEAYNSDPAVLNWFVKVAVDGNKKVVFGDEADKYPETKIMLNEYKTEAEIKAKLAALGVADANIPPLRQIDLGEYGKPGSAQYEIHTVTYDEVVKAGGYTEYLKTLLDMDKEDPTGLSHVMWSQITPTGTDPVLNYNVTEANLPPGALKPNTPYVIYFRPYTVKAAYYPTFVSATTLTTRGEVPFDPTVPTLIVITSKTTDTSVTVWWKSSKSLDYELSYSELISDYPNGGTRILPADIKAKGVAEERTDADGKTTAGTSYTITGLFPDTTYHFWIRSMAAGQDGTNPGQTSNWSNPVSEKTKDILPPDPPKGLGPASSESLKIYNTQNKLDVVAISDKYIIIEWMRDYNDINNAEAPTAPATGASVTGGSAELLSIQDIIDTYMVKFNELTPYTTYYFRAKTVLTITQSANGIERQYNYIVQMSKTDKFLEYVEVTVPPLNAPAGDKFKRKESDWSAVISLRTSKSDVAGDYDENKNPDLYPLPNLDFEASFDSATKTANFRFRSDGVGLDGLKDNYVDQRFILRLVASKAFNYDITLPTPKGEIVLNRNIEMPYSIWKTLDERKISLRLISDSTTITIQPESLLTTQFKGIKDLGNGSKMTISMKTNAKGTPVLKDGQTYSALPQSLGVTVKTKNNQVNLNELAKPVKIELKIDNKSEKMEKNIDAYIANKDSAGWEQTKSAYNTATGVLTFESRRLGSYAAVTNGQAATFPLDKYRDEFLFVTAKMSISDLTTYDSNRPLTANEFNNLVAGVAYNRKNITMSTDMTGGDFEKLGKSKLLVSGMNVPNEAGINALVKLYELKSKTAVKGQPTAATSLLPDIKAVDPQYQNNVLKAEKIGFLDDMETLNPKANMTMGDVMYMLSIIYDDAA